MAAAANQRPGRETRPGSGGPARPGRAAAGGQAAVAVTAAAGKGSGGRARQGSDDRVRQGSGGRAGRVSSPHAAGRCSSSSPPLCSHLFSSRGYSVSTLMRVRLRPAQPDGPCPRMGLGGSESGPSSMAAPRDLARAGRAGGSHGRLVFCSTVDSTR